MMSKARLKQIRSLELKKFRDAEGLFLAEGPKVVGDVLTKFPCTYVAATQEWLSRNPLPNPVTTDVLSDDELQRASLLRAPQGVLALFQKPEADATLPEANRELVLALDDVQDPGNLGTIIRLADWFGITHIICSPGCADAFAPKVVQATMGAIARVEVHYADLPTYINQLPEGTPVYGTYLDGQNIYQADLTAHGLLVMGNEGRGISPTVSRLVTERLHIPSFPAGRTTSESLNVSVATAIACAEFRRRITP